MTDLDQILANDRHRHPTTCSPQEITDALGQQKPGYYLIKKNRAKPHSPENSRWIATPHQKKAEYRALVQRLASKP